MDDEEKRRLAEEASCIFVRLEEDPEDKAAQLDREAFLARGPNEREVWQQMLKVWGGTRKPPKRNTIPSLVILGLVGTAAYFLSEPLQILLRADFASQLVSEEIVLASGDRTTLDADTALIDNTEQDNRTVELLRGAAFFEVEADARPFTVTLADVTVQVVGTAFETTLINVAPVIRVSEGVVDVSRGDQSWTLVAGEKIQFDDQGVGDITEVPLNEVADWRDDLFLADNLTFAQVAATIDRRLPGTIFILDDDLANSRVGGPIDLSDPGVALDTLAIATNARVVRTPFNTTFVWSD